MVLDAGRGVVSGCERTLRAGVVRCGFCCFSVPASASVLGSWFLVLHPLVGLLLSFLLLVVGHF